LARSFLLRQSAGVLGGTIQGFRKAKSIQYIAGSEQWQIATHGPLTVKRCCWTKMLLLNALGREEFTMFVKDLTTGQLLSEHTTEGIVSVEWARNKPCIFYTVTDSQMRPSKIFQRRLDSSTGNKLVLEDNDASRFVDVARTKDWRFITLNVNSKTSSEAGVLAGCQRPRTSTAESRASQVRC
jgi:protease II